MSSQKGNIKRTRPQKYKNKTSFRNNLHDTSKKIKEINKLEVSEVCKQCKDVIEWKIKYKKYKPLTQPKTCSNCHMKSIKSAYHILCDSCGKTLDVCCKCRQPKEVIHKPVEIKSKEEVLSMMKKDLKALPERRRRAFYRFVNTFYDPVARKKEVFKNSSIKEDEGKDSDNEKEYQEEGNDSGNEEEYQEEERKEDQEQNEDKSDPRWHLLTDEVYCEDYLEKIRRKLEELGKVESSAGGLCVSESDRDEDESFGR